MEKINKKFLIIVFVLLIIAFVFFLVNYNNNIQDLDIENVQEIGKVLVSIKNEDINEKNFTGKKSVIAGDSVVAKEAQKYIEGTIASFKERADEEVPDIRKEFGNETPSSNYSIYLEARYEKNENTESIIINEYVYTGGAHGVGSFKVYTASLKDNKIVSINDLIKEDKQSSFIVYVNKKLLDWRPEGTDAPVVFEEEISSLNMESFSNWSLDEENLIIYFDSYQVGPGALGTVAFPLPLSEVKDFIIL